MKKIAEATEVSKGAAEARLATLNVLIRTILPLFLAPVPSRETLRQWFDAAKIPRFKANPLAKRGGAGLSSLVAWIQV